MVNSSAIFSHSQCQWENLVGFIRSFIPIKWAGLQIWHCMLLYKLNEFSFQKVHISQFDCLLDQRESSTHLKVTNQDLLWQHKCVFLFTLQFESIAGVLLRIFSHWKSKTNFFSYFFFTAIKFVSWCVQMVGSWSFVCFCVETSCEIVSNDPPTAGGESNLGDGRHHLHSAH